MNGIGAGTGRDDDPVGRDGSEGARAGGPSEPTIRKGRLTVRRGAMRIDVNPDWRVSLKTPGPTEGILDRRVLSQAGSEGGRALDDVEVASLVLSAFDGKDVWKWREKGRDATRGLVDVLGDDAYVLVNGPLTERRIGISPKVLADSGLIDRALTTARSEIAEAAKAKGLSGLTVFKRSSAAAEVLALMRTTPCWEHGSAAMSDRRLLEVATWGRVGGTPPGKVRSIGDVRADARLAAVLAATGLDVTEPETADLVTSALGRATTVWDSVGVVGRTPDGDAWARYVSAARRGAVPSALGVLTGVALTAEEAAMQGLPDAARLSAEAEKVVKAARDRELTVPCRTTGRVRGGPRPETLKAFVPIGGSER